MVGAGRTAVVVAQVPLFFLVEIISQCNNLLCIFYFQCEPIHGWGFRRGGYQCRCKPGFRLPTIVRRPFLGEIVERATAEQYYNGFDCEKIGCKYY